MVRLFLCVLALSPVAISQDEINKAYLRQVNLTQQYRVAAQKGRFLSAENEIAAIKKKYKNASKAQLDVLTAEAKNMAATAKSEIKKIYEDDFGVLNLASPVAGEVGFLGDGEHLVLVKVLQVTGPDSALVKYGNLTYMLEVKTDGVVDDANYSFTNVFLVLGTTTYKTVTGGTNTVFKLQALKQEAAQAAIAYARENKLKPPKDLQTWRDIDGKVIIEAEFVSRDKNKIVVKDKDDKIVNLDYAKLSRDNRLWLKDK